MSARGADNYTIEFAPPGEANCADSLKIIHPQRRGRVISATNQVTPVNQGRHLAGWTDEALYDAISVCALFQFYNTWTDATGVRDMTPMAYEMSGHRLATEGYA